MIFDPATATHLKPWLIRTLEPICDAEPGALSDYILALLKHNVPESDMRKELAVQLDEFLEKECSNFIDTLFTVLRTKSYLPYSATSPSNPKNVDTGIPIPLDGLLAPSSTSPSRKRSNDNDERDGRPPAKGPRLSSDGQFSRYSNGRPEPRSTGGWGSRERQIPPMNDMLMMSGLAGMTGQMPGIMNGRSSQYLPPEQKRGICRDYHNSGYCARGAFCKFSHGDDAVVPSQLYGGPSMPFMPMFPGGPAFGMVPNGAYDPHEARMDMRPQSNRPQGRAPIIPREEATRIVHSHTSGELPVIQDLTPKTDDSAPETQAEGAESLPPQPAVAQYTAPTRDFSTHTPQQPMVNQSVPMAPYYMHNPSNNMDVDSPVQRPQSNGFRASRGGRGTFGGEVHSFRPERRNDKTLVVEKIPDDKLTLEHVNEWFKRFGTVTNVAIDASNAKALVSFSNHEDAHAAWKSEDAVFNNRFVKLFWHRPLQGHGQVGARMLAASAPLVANITTTPAVVTPTATASTISAPRKNPTATALAVKQQLLEQQILEQKTLMATLSTATAEEKKSIMSRLRKLGEEMKSTPSKPSTATPATPATSTTPVDREKKERERLDKELEMHNALSEDDNPEDLKAKLEKLKAEAASLGLPDATAETAYNSTTYRPYRGRGRGTGGRSFYRGAARGGPPSRASMKLDNRPKKLLVKGVNPDKLQALKDWFETTGQMESAEISSNGDVVVTFKSRSAAEQGLAKGTTVPTVGTVQLSWFTGQASISKPSEADVAMPAAPSNIGGRSSPARAISPEPEPVTAGSSHAIEEEEISTGWGGDAEDGMGMF